MGASQPFGQQPQSYGVAPPLYGQPAMPPVPSTPPKKRKVGKWVTIIVSIVGVLLLGLVGLAFVGYMVGGAHNAEPGDCLHIEDFADRRERPTVLDCSDEKATLKVGVRLEDGGSCPDGDYDEIAYEEGARLCLMLNVKEGDCLANFYSPTKGYEKVACTDPKADISIMKIVEGTDDAEQACATVPGVLGGLRYPEPATVICASEPTTA